MANKPWRYVAELYEVLDGQIRGDRLEGKYVLTVDEAKEFAIDYADKLGRRIWLGVLEPGRGYCFAMHVEVTKEPK